MVLARDAAHLPVLAARSGVVLGKKASFWAIILFAGLPKAEKRFWPRGGQKRF
jgi:hypothetical protein